MEPIRRSGGFSWDLGLSQSGAALGRGGIWCGANQERLRRRGVVFSQSGVTLLGVRFRANQQLPVCAGSGVWSQSGGAGSEGGGAWPLANGGISVGAGSVVEPIKSNLELNWDPVFGHSGAVIWGESRGGIWIPPDGGVIKSGANQGLGGVSAVQSGLRSHGGGAGSSPGSDSGRGWGPARIQSGVVWIGGAGPAPTQ